MSTSSFNLDTITPLVIIIGILVILTVLLFVLLVLIGKQAKQNKKARRDSDSISQKVPEWIKEGISESIKPELDTLITQSQRACQESDYIRQKMPVWIKEGITESVKPELDKLRMVFENYAETVGDSQTEAIEEVIDRFVAELNKKVEESASQYALRIAQSSEQFNRSLADINATVSVTLTDALGGFDSELQATLTELLNAMKKLRSVTNNIPKIIDNSFAEMQRSFDEMETEMQRTIVAFRDMRIKIEAQQNALGPVQPGMLRTEAIPRKAVPTISQTQHNTKDSNHLTESSQVTASPAQSADPISSKKDKPMGGMNFSNY